MRRTALCALRTAILFSTGVLALPLAASPAGGALLSVSPGQSIQAAIDAAPPGSTIHVSPGVYNENLLVTKDGITLQGAGPGSTLLRLPASPRATPCDPQEGLGRASGICIVGDVNFSTGEVTRRVPQARVTGFDIQNFSSYGILIIAAEGVTVDGNVSSNNSAYGVFAIDSSGIQFLSNTTNGNVQAGLYIGSSPEARAVVSGNTANGNLGEGILIGISNGGSVTNNNFSGNCVGIRLVGGPGVGVNWALSGNVLNGNNRACLGRSGAGIAVLGGHNISIEANTVNGNVASGPATLRGGIVVTSRGGTPSSNVFVVGNTAFNNVPADLIWDQAGASIVFTRNRCGTAIPPGLCST
ncbi:MAG: right-handed parallel beta-helix repeat-containing protein [Acidimicrobiales bacterium]